MNNIKNPSYLLSVLTFRCPQCRNGYLFTYKNPYKLKHTLEMPESCPKCGLKTEREVGFYYGTGYVSYALTVAFCVSVFAAWAILFGLSFNDSSIFWCMGVTITLLIILQPYFMRLSRILWLSWFVRYNKYWYKSAEHKI